MDRISLVLISDVRPVCCGFGGEDAVADTFLRHFYACRNLYGAA